MHEKSTDSPPEEWRAAPDYANIEVSSSGRVRKLVYLQARTDYNGYPLVRFTVKRNGKCIQVNVHKLVAYAFIGPRPPGHDINHIDGVKTNPAAENLEYVTRSQNVSHAYRLGLHGRPTGTKNGRARLMPEQVERIREHGRHRGPYGAKALAQELNVSPALVMDVLRGRSWGGPAVIQGRYTNFGSHNGTAKLTEDQVTQARRLASDQTHEAIASLYGVSRRTMNHAIRGDTWDHVIEAPVLNTKRRPRRLTEQEVHSIKKALPHTTGKALSEHYGVSKSVISGIRHGRYWRHVK